MSVIVVTLLAGIGRVACIIARQKPRAMKAATKTGWIVRWRGAGRNFDTIPRE
jgi:hypothetical protein